MTKKCVHRIFRIHAAAVVTDGKTGDSAVFDTDRNAVTPGIQCVFHEFLDDTHRAFHHLACRDHIGSLFIQLMYSSHRKNYTEASEKNKHRIPGVPSFRSEGRT